jgi:hypothetical protein
VNPNADVAPAEWQRSGAFFLCSLGLAPLTEDKMDTTTLLIILVLVLILFGGGFYGRGRWW